MLAVCVAVSASIAVGAVTLPVLVRSSEAGWPQWRGPQRDGVASGSGLLPRWPPNGPPVLWSVQDIGNGYSSPIIAGGRIFITGDVGDRLRITALDLSGKRIWQTTNGESWRGSYPGARGACAYAQKRLFHMNAHGRVACLDPANGKELWAVDALDRFGGRLTEWGYSECLLVDWPRVIVTAGGSRASVVALDALTGRTIWESPPIAVEGAEQAGHDAPGYVSPVLLRLGHRRLILGCTEMTMWIVDALTGRRVWSHPLPTRYRVLAMTPVVAADGFLMTGPDTEAGAFWRLSLRDGEVRVEQAWKTTLDACQGGATLANGRIYGARYRRRGWVSLDPATGAQREETTELAMGASIVADGKLICVAQDGEVALVRPTEKGFAFDGRFRPFEGVKGDLWAHPVLLDGRLYLRAHDQLKCYDLRAAQRGAPIRRQVGR